MRLPFALECVARVSSSKQLTLQEELRRAFQNENWKRNLSELLLTFPLFLFFFFSSVWPSVKMDKFILILTNFQKYKPKYNYKYKSRLAPDSGRDGSMESIDEHCKNFATSSWTQFKVPLNQTLSSTSSPSSSSPPTSEGVVYSNILLHHARRNFDQPEASLTRCLRSPYWGTLLGYW